MTNCRNVLTQTTVKTSFLLTTLTAIFIGLSAHAAFEIADVTDVGFDFRGYTRVYIAYGDNPITEEEWQNYSPSLGYIKNTPRNGEFNDENTFSSPGLPAPDVQIVTIDGYTWKFIAQTQSAMHPYSHEIFPDTLNAYQAAFATTTPPLGAIKFSSNEKNQEMIFWARENNDPEGAPILRFYITDQWGNRYIMGASGAETDEDIPASFAAAVLPEGWTKSTGYLDETLSLMPAYGAGNQAHYNLFRESSDNTFFQIEWGESGHSIAEQIPGMPIWGGATSDLIYGRADDDNLIHGAQGDDTIIVLGLNDIIFGDDGVDTAVLLGNFAAYTVELYALNGAELILSGFGNTKTFYDVEFLQFDDLLIATSAIPEPASFILVLAGVAWSIALYNRKRKARNR